MEGEVVKVRDKHERLHRVDKVTVQVGLFPPGEWPPWASGGWGSRDGRRARRRERGREGPGTEVDFSPRRGPVFGVGAGPGRE